MTARNPLLNRTVWQLAGERLNLDAMREAAAKCLGEHDFAAFGTPPQRGSGNTVRQVFQSRWEMETEDLERHTPTGFAARRFCTTWCAAWWERWCKLGAAKLSLTGFEAIMRSCDVERAKVLGAAAGIGTGSGRLFAAYGADCNL